MAKAWQSEVKRVVIELEPTAIQEVIREILYFWRAERDALPQKGDIVGFIKYGTVVPFVADLQYIEVRKWQDGNA